MADEIDRAQDQEAAIRQREIDAVRSRSRGLAASGACHYCGEPLHGLLLWCPDGCKEDWEMEQRLLQRAGRRPE